MIPELQMHIRAVSRLIYVITDEEDRFIKDLYEFFKKNKKQNLVPTTFVFNYTTGIRPIETVVEDWTKRNAPDNPPPKVEINSVLQEIYKTNAETRHFYVFLDPDRMFNDQQVVRRLLNIVHEQHNDPSKIKILMFVGPRRAIPEKLSRYMEVVYDPGLNQDEINNIVGETCAELAKVKGNSVNVTPPENAPALFRAMTSWEVNAAIAQSISITKKDDDLSKRFVIDPKIITAYRRRALKKTDLLQYVDTSEFTFDQVGGYSRFKEWVKKTRAAWTAKGREYGLEPPKGVLAVGIWGCGKSLSVKAMGSAWGLPVVQLETGKLRSAQQGASEANVYHAIHMIERVSPCIVWIDEAEKSLSGGRSSDQTDSGTTSRMIGILSTWLQETSAQVCLALTANSLATLPIEFVNRVDQRFFFDMPSKKDRIDILKIHLLKRKQDPRRFDLDVLANACDFMVGREIEQAIKESLIECFDRGSMALDFDVMKNVFVRKPRLAKTMVDEVRGLIEWVGYDKEADDGIRARYAAPPTNKVTSSLEVVA